MALFRHLNVKKGAKAQVFCTFDLEMRFAPQRRALFRHLDVKKWSEHVVLLPLWLGNVLCATTASIFTTAELPKVVWAWCILYILTWRCASHHNGVHFFDISTSKSGPELVCFVHFWLEMCFAPQWCPLYDSWTSKSGLSMVCFVYFDLEICFAPQRPALFQQLNFHKWSDVGVFCTFWLRNLLRATTACNFSSLLWPAGSRRFSEVTFRPSGATNHWTNTVNRDFPTFSRTCIFFLLTFSISYFLTSWLLLFDSSHLCFSISAYCRKFDF